MRLAVIADIHGNVPALEAVLADIAHRGVNVAATIDLGDCVSGPLWPVETFELLQKLSLPTVRGNHDRALGTPVAGLGASDAFASSQLAAAAAAASGSWEAYPQTQMAPAACRTLAALPPLLHPLPGVVACHGTPGDDLTYLLEDVTDETLTLASAATIASRLGDTTANLVLCAHSHQPRVVRSGRTLIVNPGSVGCPAYEDPGAPRHVSETGTPHARYAIIDDDTGDWAVTFVAVLYDWNRAAARAVANGRPEWATTLTTGRMR